MDYKQDAERPSNAGGPRKATKQKSIKKVVGIAIASVVLVAVLAVSTVLVLTNSNKGATASINKDDYQAVFLTNGQVYFGKLQNSNGEYLKLTDIYYLQVDSAVQQAGAEAEATTDENSNVQLIKLGNELHGPRDEMQLNNQQVLFWENLKPDSRVSEAIKNYQE
jgi:GTP:adenosylcobinamide-phosphate guanylyltransferase